MNLASDICIKCPMDHLIFLISIFMIIIMKMGETTHVGPGSFKDTEFCDVSKLTRTVVDNCPSDHTGVMEAASRKNCSAIKSICLGRLEYHCVINPWGNLTVEVCAPVTQIRAGFCAEYNEGGGNIQEYHKKTCSTCKKKYLSVHAYKYPECYPKLNMVKGYAVEKSQDSFPRYQCSLADNGVKASILKFIWHFCIQILLLVVVY